MNNQDNKPLDIKAEAEQAGKLLGLDQRGIRLIATYIETAYLKGQIKAILAAEAQMEAHINTKDKEGGNQCTK